jgi:hypothetical protein
MVEFIFAARLANFAGISVIFGCLPTTEKASSAIS